MISLKHISEMGRDCTEVTPVGRLVPYLHSSCPARCRLILRLLLYMKNSEYQKFDSNEGVYAVADLSIKYRRPARLDDALTVVSHVQAVGAATATIHQAVMRGDELLTEATVTAAFLTREGRPRRQPKPWVEAFQKLVSN